MKKKEYFVLAIDCGSTNFNSILLDQNGETLARKSAPIEYEKDIKGILNISPTIASKTSKAIVKAMIRSMKIPQASITHFAVTSQAQTFLIVNKEYEPLTPLISWIDSRAEDEAKELMAKLSKKLHKHTTFPIISSQMTASKLLWAKKHYASLQETDKWRLMFLPEWIMYCFTGKHITDNNLAAMSGLYSLKNEDWYDEVLQAIDVKKQQLPDVIKIGKKKKVKLQKGFGRTWLSKEVFLIGAGNDQTADAFGNMITEDELLITLDTTLVIYRLRNKKGPFAPDTAWGPFPYDKYYELATLTEGCLALEWAKEKIQKGTPIKQFEEMAKMFFETHKKKLPDTLFFYPQKIKESSPWLNNRHNASALAYSVFEGITFTIRKLIEEKFKERHPKTICATGEGSASDFWLSLIANVLRGKVRKGKGDAVFGAGMMAVKNNLIYSKEQKDYYDDVYSYKSEPENVALLEKRYVLWNKHK